MSFGIFFKKPARTISVGSITFNCPITLPFKRSLFLNNIILNFFK